MRATVLYDGSCRLCRFTARRIAALDCERELALLPFEDPDARPLLDRIPDADRYATWHVVSSDGGRASGGPGLLAVAGALRRTRPIVPLLRLLPLDALYRVTARNRRRLGRLVPDGPAPRRT